MNIVLGSAAEDYRTFLKVKSLPVYSFAGRQATFPDEYASGIVGANAARAQTAFKPISGLFDYQKDITKLALRKQKFAIFADCGLGKSLCYFEWARHVLSAQSGGVLIVTPAMVVPQMVAEVAKFYGDSLPVERVAAKDLPTWLESCAGRLGITNYESLHDDLPRGQLGGLILDESSVLKSHYGAWGSSAIRLGRGLDWKLCGTGTPAPNDRIEYANHAVFLDRFPTVNSFLAKYFVNKGQTQERWILKPHALKPFYLGLSDWSIFLTNPATYGWKDNCGTIPPIHVHVHDVPMTESQTRAVRKETGCLIAGDPGGIGGRHALSRIAKGIGGVETLKYEYIRDLVGEWPGKSTIVWCWFNEEQDRVEEVLQNAASVQGSTDMDDRIRLIDEFKSGAKKVLISKPKVLGFGLNLQVATKQVFSSLIDSYEQYYQAVKRSNRVGSTVPLDVHIPVCDAERPMVENVLRKADMVQKDTEEQEILFKENGRIEW